MFKSNFYIWRTKLFNLNNAMRKVVLALILHTILLGTSSASVPLEAFPLVNSLSDLWYNGKTQAAIDSSLRLFKIYPEFLIQSYHSSLSQQIKKEKIYPNPNVYLNLRAYLEGLISRKNEELNRIVEPLNLWSKTIHDSDKVRLNKTFVELSNTLGDSSNYESYAELYALLALNEPTVQQFIDKSSREKLLHTIIRNLETYPNLESQVKGWREQEKRAWNRYLLAYCYNMLYKDVDPKESYLRNAFRYSPDELDVQNKNAYFYDAFLLTGNVQQIGYREDFLIFLVEHHRTQEATTVLAEIAFNMPSDENMKALKSLYEGESPQIPFKEYWYSFVNQKSKKAPLLKIEFAEGTLNLTKNRDHWVYIDVWGTWCEPCVRELPVLQEYFENNKQRLNSAVKIYTFSYNSQNVATFMKDKDFTFPVAEIDKNTNDAFEVVGYPTKILISPTGNYLKIPYNSDWRMFLKNYCLLE
jgi:thiol-disulfide isomerase/thioredoxin